PVGNSSAAATRLAHVHHLVVRMARFSFHGWRYTPNAALCGADLFGTSPGPAVVEFRHSLWHSRPAYVSVLTRSSRRWEAAAWASSIARAMRGFSVTSR